MNREGEWGVRVYELEGEDLHDEIVLVLRLCLPILPEVQVQCDLVEQRLENGNARLYSYDLYSYGLCS